MKFFLVFSILIIISNQSVFCNNLSEQMRIQIARNIRAIIRDWNKKHEIIYERDVAVVNIGSNISFFDTIMKNIPRYNPVVTIQKSCYTYDVLRIKPSILIILLDDVSILTF
jgi:hypothetical protein